MVYDFDFLRYNLLLMNKIFIKNTLNINLDGIPSKLVEDRVSHTTLSVTTKHIALVKPRLLHKKGDAVKLGEPLFADKTNPDVTFASPGSGVISHIEYGERRLIERVIITLADNEEPIQHKAHTEKEIASISRDDLISHLLEGGLWYCIKALPFRAIANPKDKPSSIILSLSDQEPFQPETGVLFKDQDGLLRLGIDLLQRLSDNVIIACHDNDDATRHLLADVVNCVVSGDYPAMDPGVINYKLKTSQDENAAWYIKPQDLIRIVQFLKTGLYPTEIIAVIGGSESGNPIHIRTREGASIQTLIQNLPNSVRFVAGGVFTGRSVAWEDGLSYGEYAVQMLPEGKEPEMLHFFKPGFERPSYFRAFMSSVLPQRKWALNTSLNGGVRSCISCSACPDVCPVDLYPQFLMKSLYDNDIETALNQGLLDCVECGLCSHVCPSKIELVDQIRASKHQLFKEMTNENAHI